MINSLKGLDKELDLIDINKKDIINSITLNDVKTFLESLGVDQIDVQEEKGYLICPTICHNPLHEEASMKLYWYQDHKIFRCYTECNEAMSIFKLYQKFIWINEGEKITLEEAEDYVKHCLHHIIKAEHKPQSNYSLDLTKYQYNDNIPTLDAYPSYILSYFTNYYHPQWLHDGITKEAMDKFNIKFSLGQNKIIIPHYDINGRLIGIRGRTLDEKEIELTGGKYKPIQIGSTIYSHPLQFNLYGIYEHQNGIRKRRSAIIAEGEKSVLLDEGYYHELSNCVACCGSNINKYHIQLLVNNLDVNEIIIALDKEYQEWNSPKGNAYRKKLEHICKQYKNLASFSYIWDFDNVLKEKDSPFDRGKEIFEYLYKTRIRVN